MLHNHDSCKHELKYCSKCDVVHCSKCTKEWGGSPEPYYPVTPYLPTYPPYIPTYPLVTYTTSDLPT